MRKFLSSICGFALISALLSGGLASISLAQSLSDFDKTPVIRVQGEAYLNVQPDRARLDIGVVSEAKTAADATKRNLKKMNEVLGKIKKKLGSRGEVPTSGYAVLPVYKTPKKSGERVLSGFRADHNLEVTTDDLSVMGPLIDLAVESGASRIRGLEFMLEDEGSIRKKVLALASKRAQMKADAIARALDLKIVRVVRVEESGPPGHPPAQRMKVLEAGQASTPIETGTIRVEAAVTLSVEIEKK